MKKENNNKKTIKLIIQRSEETIEFGDFIGEVIEMPITQVIEEKSGVNKSPLKMSHILRAGYRILHKRTIGR